MATIREAYEMLFAVAPLSQHGSLQDISTFAKGGLSSQAGFTTRTQTGFGGGGGGGAGIQTGLGFGLGTQTGSGFLTQICLTSQLPHSPVTNV